MVSQNGIQRWRKGWSGVEPMAPRHQATVETLHPRLLLAHHMVDLLLLAAVAQHPMEPRAQAVLDAAHRMADVLLLAKDAAQATVPTAQPVEVAAHLVTVAHPMEPRAQAVPDAAHRMVDVLLLMEDAAQATAEAAHPRPAAHHMALKAHRMLVAQPRDTEELPHPPATRDTEELLHPLVTRDTVTTMTMPSTATPTTSPRVPRPRLLPSPHTEPLHPRLLLPSQLMDLWHLLPLHQRLRPSPHTELLHLLPPRTLPTLFSLPTRLKWML